MSQVQSGWPVPSLPGTYLLLLRVVEPLVLRAGSLRQATVPAGCYVYSGSALGPGGLAARVQRHVRLQKKQHWHIDYLTASACLEQVFWQVGPTRLECAWCRRLMTHLGAWAVVPGFGSSDCKNGCPAHLLALPEAVDRQTMMGGVNL